MAITASPATSSIYGKVLEYAVSCEENPLGAMLEGVVKIISNYYEDERALKRKCTNNCD